jgi:hypothetical protein
MTDTQLFAHCEAFQSELALLLRRYGISCSTFHGMIRVDGKLRNMSIVLENEAIQDSTARSINRAAFDAGREVINYLSNGIIHEKTDLIYPKKNDEMPT